MPARSEPLLWVQLIGAGVFPLEGLLLFVLLAGSDPGPVPGLERLLCWSLGVLGPTVLLWRRPADVWSLLLLQTPLRARRPLQQRLSRLQDAGVLRLGLVLGGLIALPLLWWLDDHAAVASSLSPLQESPRLVVLLLAAVLLALMLWQWQQLLQALWLLTRSSEALAAAKPMPQAELEERRLCLGLPLLLLDPLQLTGAAPASSLRAVVTPQPTPQPVASASAEGAAIADASEATPPEPGPAELPRVPSTAGPAADAQPMELPPTPAPEAGAAAPIEPHADAGAAEVDGDIAVPDAMDREGQPAVTAQLQPEHTPAPVEPLAKPGEMGSASAGAAALEAEILETEADPPAGDQPGSDPQAAG